MSAQCLRIFCIGSVRSLTEAGQKIILFLFYSTAESLAFHQKTAHGVRSLRQSQFLRRKYGIFENVIRYGRHRSQW